MIATHYRSLDASVDGECASNSTIISRRSPAKPASKIQIGEGAHRGAARRATSTSGATTCGAARSVKAGVPAGPASLEPTQRKGRGRPDRLRPLALRRGQSPHRPCRRQPDLAASLRRRARRRRPDDFGTEGAAPTHPELLDWLATEYRRLGWSRKALIRLIVDLAGLPAVFRHPRRIRPSMPPTIPSSGGRTASASKPRRCATSTSPRAACSRARSAASRSTRPCPALSPRSAAASPGPSARARTATGAGSTSS